MMVDALMIYDVDFVWGKACAAGRVDSPYLQYLMVSTYHMVYDLFQFVKKGSVVGFKPRK